MTRTVALVVAGGSGSRMGGELPKQYQELGGIPVLRRAVIPFADHPRVDEVRVVVAEGRIEDACRAVGGGFGDVQPIVGGETRGESVWNGLKAIDGDIVLIHDAARPFCPAVVIDRLLEALAQHSGAVPVLPVHDTLARWTGLLGESIEREGVVRVQTPQAFDLAKLRAAYDRWEGPFPSDDAAVAKAAGLSVGVVAGSFELEKLTTPEDWKRAEASVASRKIVRTGIGFDVHAFGGEGPVMLGGISIPHERGLAGHSDADVALHAMTDALLGAAGLGDIGDHFPPSDPQWKDMSSDRFLLHAAAQIFARGGVIDHLDCTIICEAPKIAPHREAMRAYVADLLNLRIDQVSIKATTTERLGFAGRREGIAAQAAATIRLEASL
ncbi:MAG TPA: bifunctional 2-C-methyl-D-erythritol 4-phosphate cytidylyltransferase/2-C-methyl-D-erythritol 2,4-cyclodiphosphate synthase [Allosphingosinicella sp.]|nr:bifunctional 2-C-methyl-D-erythritol 4-phosphate cytidylyltransferase/2-C-methyl-D-erythritol 2,4-cyclodiphosphate synthase [Allosphingosinicella sp.]